MRNGISAGKAFLPVSGYRRSFVVPFVKSFPRSLLIQELVESFRVVEVEPDSDSISGMPRAVVYSLSTTSSYLMLLQSLSVKILR